MSAPSSSTAAVSRRAMVLPLICCPSCKQKVSRDFWRWELEYDEYLVDKHYLVGDAAMDAIGGAEERREQLAAAQELVQMNAPISRSNKFAKKEASCGMSRQQAFVLMMLGRKLVKLMKMLFAAVVVLGLAVVVLMLKK
ncbi:hypothetical protein ZWY2020_036648 [Hordeum vulgare]|nr:hypothetical protein ZWY2020_036648 [Hordeum vulgare]